MILSALLAITGLVILASLLSAPEALDAPAWLAATAGLVFLGIGYLGTVRAPRWYRRATAVVRAQSPVRALITLHQREDRESISLYAVVESIETVLTTSEVSLNMPRRDMQHWLGHSLTAQVYIDPANGRLVALDIEAGRLWSLPQH
jgi:hypothetical protein